MESITAVNQLAALAQEHRLAIFRLLVQQGQEGLAVGRIAEALGLANATLSFHLKTLATAGLIEARQDGRFIHYSASFDAMNALLGFLSENCCAGEPCLIAPAPCCPPEKKP
ncbi:ArsR/SmtB family transcription factor [Uliginosibacterium aquaticum]|uniref:Winged helix-turn-helix transcriptional regulator n=1 Tax=Uliginosibacterium aquaticum TaxID=2731212 RepID=A0ABX2IGT0_9RHOO|nr:metalloregulator ArsR/SmtB family transcription factor [Uliginosibacterium aquaticum]NSL55712.1 winged helix-turn-helix transcriptional regulator [Uliginosibacterium aquaticum]